jgi:alginate O-acetyltransferase complex protein AlgI
MLFSTPFFLFAFLPLFLALYWLGRPRRQLLLFGSMVFYAWAEPTFIWIVLASACLDYGLGLWIAKLPDGRMRGTLVGIGVVTNLSMLVIVKYSGFAVQNFNALLQPLTSVHFVVPAFVLPLGISFIVFEKITYLVDLKRGIARPARSFLDYLNFVFLFPKLLAGPIIKYHEIAAQLRRPSHRFEDFRDGAVRFATGLAKKVLVANQLAIVVDPIFSLPTSELDPVTAWLGLIAFTLQIYFDFSGYSDIAIGLARMLGFRLRENFNQPYLATSVTDFWRRWHISLSTWIKEYLYIPLGGNRVSTVRSYVNLCICFVLSGLWHGASWNFVIWGSLHGVAMVVDRAFWLRFQQGLPRILNIGITFAYIALTWVFFRCDTFGHALKFLGALGGRHAQATNAIVPQTDTLLVLAAALGIVFAPLVLSRLRQREIAPGQSRVRVLAFVLVLVLVTIGRMTIGSFTSFLYFRF